MKKRKTVLHSSFRDPSGFIFEKSGVIYRQVNKRYKKEFDLLMDSGLYDFLAKNELLVPHRVSKTKGIGDEAHKVLKPKPLPFISYPYEWSFSQLKDAALLTLKVQKEAMKRGMVLKDASAYNIQFVGSKPIFIDLLSFERHKDGQPWIAYKQFCEHFLSPLCLMAIKDVRLGLLLRTYIDGIPLELSSKLLPKSTYLRMKVLTHIHLHAKAQNRFAKKKVKRKTKFSKRHLQALVDSLEGLVRSLEWEIEDSEWGDYYKMTNYSKKAFDSKRGIIGEYIEDSNPELLWDLGANTGEFSRIATQKGAYVISFDMDPVVVEKNYVDAKKNSDENILPLLMDFTNPSPGVGWAHRERNSLINRTPDDTLMALALIHHLAISNNLPFEKIAEFFSKISRNLIIEFVPKDDSQVKKLLRNREDIFDQYNSKQFEEVFSKFFTIKKNKKIVDSKRVVYLMERKK